MQHNQYSIHQLRHLRFIIGQNIQQQRVRRRMPLHKLARLSEVSENLLDHYELGKSEIRLEHLFRIACVLEIDVKKLF